MKWNLAISLTSVLLLFPLISQSQSASGTQQTQDASVVASPAPPVVPVATDSSTQVPGQVSQSMRDHYRSCHETLDQARNQAHTLSRDANRQNFNIDTLSRQHQQLQEQIQTLKANREQFLGDLSDEQQKSIQDHSQSMQQINDRIQGHLEAIDHEFTGSNIHLAVISSEAKAAEQDIRSYHKELQEAGKAFNLLSN